MSAAARLRIGGVLFEGFELLDFYGPLELFGLLEDRAQITVVAEYTGAIKSSVGPCGLAEATMKEASDFDVLLIPGGIGTRAQMRNPGFVGDLKRLAEASQIVATVCTGSLLLAKTGLLDGRPATTNKRVFKLVQSYAPLVDWCAKARWVESDKFFTSSGVSAGMDMTLAVIAKVLGREVSLEVAHHAEYEWHEDASWDPFAAGMVRE